MDLSLKAQIHEDMKSSMRSKDTNRLGIIRMIMAAIKQREVDERITLSDLQIIEALDKMLKQRRESIAQYQAAQRNDLADKEAYEISVIQEYLPPALDETELDNMIKDAVTNSGATSPKDMGKVIGILKPQVQGRADMGKVSAKVKETLSTL